MNVNRSKNNNINIIVNRLSGAYEAPLLESVQNLYMLEGNLFACRKSGEVKIKNDPYYDTAVTKCGSYQYNFALIFLASGALVILVMFASPLVLSMNKREAALDSIKRAYAYVQELSALRRLAKPRSRINLTIKANKNANNGFQDMIV